MEYLKLKNRRLKLLNLVKVGSFQSIVTKEFVASGLVLPRFAKDALRRLQKSKCKGCFNVLWKDYIGGEECYRPLESNITIPYLLAHPNLIVRIHVVDCCDNSQGYIEPELFFGFIPDWEDRL